MKWSSYSGGASPVNRASRAAGRTGSRPLPSPLQTSTILLKRLQPPRQSAQRIENHMFPSLHRDAVWYVFQFEDVYQEVGKMCVP